MFLNNVLHTENSFSIGLILINDAAINVTLITWRCAFNYFSGFHFISIYNPRLVGSKAATQNPYHVKS